jgi:hypothetical protein
MSKRITRREPGDPATCHHGYSVGWLNCVRCGVEKPLPTVAQLYGWMSRKMRSEHRGDVMGSS